MQDLPWKICQYFFTEECPYQFEISKAILIPQMLGPSEIEHIKNLCENCEKCRDEKRTNLRIKKPLRVALVNPAVKKSVQGTVLDISSTGALIKLDIWLDVKIGETLELKIYSYSQDKQAEVSVGDRRCIVKRLAKNPRHLALMFMSE
jgi:hypothetical protein